MKFTKIADMVLRAAVEMKCARQVLKDDPQLHTAQELALAHFPHKRWLRKLLRQQTVGVVFMLCALVRIGSREDEQDFDLLDVYCRVSGKARTQRAAIFYLLWEKQLFDFLNRGWDRVEARGIDLDKWMAPGN